MSSPWFGRLSVSLLSNWFAAVVMSLITLVSFTLLLKKRRNRVVKPGTIHEYPEESVEHIPYVYERLPEPEMLRRSKDFYLLMQKRRSLRMFSSDSVPLQLVENIIKTAGTAPSGAHTQPWTFVVVSDNSVKEKIREIVEREEEINYLRRMGETWVKDLKPFNTNWCKPYLQSAPHLIVVLRQTHGYGPDGQRKEHYYNEISVSISIGLLLAAIQVRPQAKKSKSIIIADFLECWISDPHYNAIECRSSTKETPKSRRQRKSSATPTRRLSSQRRHSAKSNSKIS